MDIRHGPDTPGTVCFGRCASNSPPTTPEPPSRTSSWDVWRRPASSTTGSTWAVTARTPTDDYPDFAERLGRAVADGPGRPRHPDLRLGRRRQRRREQDPGHPRRDLPRHLFRAPGRGARRHEHPHAGVSRHRVRTGLRDAPWPSWAPRSAASRATSGGSTRSSRSRRPKADPSPRRHVGAIADRRTMSVRGRAAPSRSSRVATDL